MAIEVIIHISNADPILGEVNELPGPGDHLIMISNPRMKDGKDLHFLSNNVVTVIWPIHNMTFIEVLPSEAEERIVGFVRE
ncbi:MAG: hypothetical protein KKD28_12155 [Chloroflexi bacterium]|nr:hypothetical protein [Chloroflexota bacterium]